MNQFETIKGKFEQLKKRHPEALLLFRCGDFYECYADDAVKASEVLGITLTKSKEDGTPMAGFPHHALDTYLPKLIHAGFRVAICDDLGKEIIDSHIKDLMEYVDAELSSEDIEEFRKLKAIKSMREREEFLEDWRAILRDVVNDWATENKIKGGAEPYYKAFIATISNPAVYK